MTAGSSHSRVRIKRKDVPQTRVRKARNRSNGRISFCPQKKYVHSCITLEPQILIIIQLAQAGFFYHPTQSHPDNVACFLCLYTFDSWEKGDDALVEHLKHAPNCGWAIVASIERGDEEYSQQYPASSAMIEARKATFAGIWPHDGKRGWKCKTKQV